MSTQQVFAASFYIEGSRMYQINGTYYIINTQPASSEHTLKSSGGPFGPYTQANFSISATTPVPGGGNPHQGGLVDTPTGDWYYMAFVDAYPGGRMPVLSPISFDMNGFPQLPNIDSFTQAHPSPVASVVPIQNTGVDTFDGSLGPAWE